MDKQTFERRRENLRRLMREAGLQAMLITLDANRYYLSGFERDDPQMNESAGRLVITPSGKDWLCTDPRYVTAAERLWDSEHILIYQGNAMERINTLLRDIAQGPVGFEASNISVADYDTVSCGLAMQRSDGMVESLRMIKEPEEVARLSASCKVNHRLMRWVPGILVPGRTEAQVAWDIEQFFRNNGAEGLSFASIVAAGENAALPHAVPGNVAIAENQGVLVDVGCRLDDYCSDQTRSFWVGERPDPVFARDLELVQEAQIKAIKAMHPGAVAADIFAQAMGWLEQNGVGHLFTHGLGHGIGLQTHEAPSLGGKSQTVLKPGMVITVEPGVYRPGQCGVRWEYMVLVTEDGVEVL